jgi:ATP-dependent DNA helicase Rep
VLICTFHALGVRMVREDGHALGLKPSSASWTPTT